MSKGANNADIAEATRSVRDPLMGLYGGVALTFASVGMLAVGFQVGKSREIERRLEEIRNQELRFGAQGGREMVELTHTPFSLARKALGYGTILCLSGATIATVGACYWLDIHSVEEFSHKMRVVVPIFRTRLLSFIDPSLHMIRGTVGKYFETLRPNFIKESDMPERKTPSEIDLEKRELDKYGFDSSIIDGYKPHNSATSSPQVGRT